MYSGKTAKLNDTALQTASNTSAYLRYNKADYNLTDLGASPPIVFPAPTADWGNFSLINLGGKATFPVITSAMIVSSQDLSQTGMPEPPLNTHTNQGADHVCVSWLCI